MYRASQGHCSFGEKPQSPCGLWGQTNSPTWNLPFVARTTHWFFILSLIFSMLLLSSLLGSKAAYLVFDEDLSQSGGFLVWQNKWLDSLVEIVHCYKHILIFSIGFLRLGRRFLLRFSHIHFQRSIATSKEPACFFFVGLLHHKMFPWRAITKLL